MTQTATTRTAWYIGCRQDEVGEAAILVGDRARIDRIAEHLEDPHFVEENRGLRTVTGTRAGKRITVTAFGMGAPIATIVLHELFDLGIRTFLRIGTAMVFPPAVLGDFVLADGGVRSEGTSRTYAPLAFPAVADFDLGLALRASLKLHDVPWRAGIFGTYDGFYTEMFALSEGEKRMIDGLRSDIRKMGLIGTDMETATLLTAGRILGARTASLCLGTVDGLSQDKIEPAAMAAKERQMFEIALDAVAASLSSQQDLVP
ncbi:MAG: nucleoside phosphorylase [Rhizobiales bacterium]|nr:nucleoside phosphorylase [Hyphomicrobiales bacterium]